MSEVSWVRTVYLYLFALVGLIITVIGSTMLVNLALKTWIFTEADRDPYVSRPPVVVFDRDLQLMEDLKNCGENCELSEVQLNQIDQWIQDYQWWQENEKGNDVNYQTRQRQNQASTAVSMIIVGLPLYLYHWAIIKRDRRKNKKSDNV